MACVILSGARSAKSKDLYCFENHRGGDGFFERGVVHESFKTAFIELFAGEVKPDGAAVVKKVDIKILLNAAILVLQRGVAGCPRRGGSGQDRNVVRTW